MNMGILRLGRRKLSPAVSRVDPRVIAASTLVYSPSCAAAVAMETEAGSADSAAPKSTTALGEDTHTHTYVKYNFFFSPPVKNK